MINKTLGKIALFSFLLLGLIAVSSPAIYAAVDTKAKPAATAKTSAKKDGTNKPKSKKKTTSHRKKHSK